MRPKPPVNFVPPNHKAKGWAHARVGSHMFPKRKFNQVHGEILRSKIEHCSLISHPFRITFSGIDCVCQPAGGDVFFNFILQFFIIMYFERERLNT